MSDRPGYFVHRMRVMGEVQYTLVKAPEYYRNHHCLTIEEAYLTEQYDLEERLEKAESDLRKAQEAVANLQAELQTFLDWKAANGQRCVEEKLRGF